MKYTLAEKIARGAESILYHAYLDSGEECCIKRIKRFQTKKKHSHEKEHLIKYPSAIKHLKNEFDIGKNLSGIDAFVQMYSFEELTKFTFNTGYDLVMEYIPGDDFSDEKLCYSLDFKTKYQLFIDAAKAIAQMHKKGYVHLDIKPSNLMLSEGKLRVIDFGVSSFLGLPSPFVGTRGYMSPEQINREQASTATDVFALTITFNKIFGGSRLSQSHHDLKAKYVGAVDTSPLIISPNVRDCPDLVQLIKTCLSPNPKKRISDCQRLSHHLESIGREYNIIS